MTREDGFILKKHLSADFRTDEAMYMTYAAHDGSTDTFTHTYEIRNKTLDTNNPLVSIFVFGKQYTDKQATVSDGTVTLTF